MNNHYESFKDKFEKFTNSLKKYHSSFLLIILILIIGAIAAYRIKIQMDIGPIWDTYDFLSNALLFAGKGTGYSDLTRPPLISFLTSIIFRLDYVSPTVIFILDGLLYIFGVIGLFLLLKLRFSDLESFLGALLYATFPMVIAFSGLGLSDIPSVSFSIWAIYFTILAVKKNSKYFYLSFPFIMLAFLTRYPSALIIFPITFYIFINLGSINKNRDIIIGILSSFLLLIPVLAFFYTSFGNPFYPFLNFFGSSSAAVSAGNFAYNSDTLYFIKNLPSFIGFQGIMILIIILAGLLVYGIVNLKNKTLFKTKILDILHFKRRNTQIKLILVISLTLIFIGTFSKINWIGSEILFIILCYFLYDISKNLNIKYLDLDMLVFAWFMTFFIFHSIFLFKDNRYFVTMAPAVSYFLIFGLNVIYTESRLKIRNIHAKSYLFSIILIFIILLSTISYLPSIQEDNINHKLMNKNIESASSWLTNYDPDYKDKIIYSNLWPYSGWNLKMNVGMMPIFKDGQKYYTGVKEYNLNQQDSNEFNNYLVSNNAYYYFSVIQGLNLTSYIPIKQFGNIIIYKKI